ncbi:MAG: M23 family metallopeptidase [Gammaproteobacteria bacterium]|nr:M23 family metallopeptidase [Gammaproteobacteria bacterium]
MTLEIGSKNGVMSLLKARWLQCTVVAVLALTWWRGESWLTDLRRLDEGAIGERISAEAEAAKQAVLMPLTIDVIVGANDTLEMIFRKLELSVADLASLRALPDLRRSLDRLYPGELLKFGVRDSELVSLERQLSPSETLQVKREADGFESEVIINPLERTVRVGEATIRNSLFQAADDAGLSDSLALRIADIFRWDIDFVLDIQPGDRFRVIYEELSQDGTPLGEGDVLAVEFVNQGAVYRAIRFAHGEVTGDASMQSDASMQDEGDFGYYTPDGKSLRKAFLRAPLEFTRVSSRFNMFRRHPVLNRIRAHRGVDYAAPIGTPVKAAGEGRVRFIGNKGGYGKVIEIQHANEVRTVYGHLSRFARGLRQGERVRQGEIIGFVGMTGLATGPHLHYEYLLSGVHKDPQKVALPNDRPISASRMGDFKAHAAPLLAGLESGQVTPALLAMVAAPISTGTAGR